MPSFHEKSFFRLTRIPFILFLLLLLMPAPQPALAGNSGNVLPPDSATGGTLSSGTTYCQNPCGAKPRAFIDGYPACWADPIDQEQWCGSVFSKNGIDTNDKGDGTQTGGGYQCVELAVRYFLFRWSILLPNVNAGYICTAPFPRAADDGKYKIYFPKDHYTPVHGDLMVYPIGPGLMSAGHVAVVNSVQGTNVNLVEQNWVTLQPHPGTRTDTMANAECWVHAVANPGTGGCGQNQTSGGTIPNHKPVCSQEKVVGWTFDGYPVFGSAPFVQPTCDGYTIASSDGKNTNATGTGYPSELSPYGYQCAELAARYFHFKWNIDLSIGNAGDLCGAALPPGAVHASKPTAGDLIIFAPGSCGAGGVGHVGVVNAVGNGTVDVADQNWGVPGGTPTEPRKGVNQSCACTFIHATTNDGKGGSTGNTGASCGTPAIQAEALALSIFNTGPTVDLDTNKNLELFVRGDQGMGIGVFQNLENNSDSTNWTGWNNNFINLSLFNGDPVVARNANGGLDLFFINMIDFSVWHSWQMTLPDGNNPNGIWAPAIPIMGTALGSNLTTGLDGKGILHIFYVGQDGAVWEAQQRAPNEMEGWLEPVSLGVGGQPTGNIGVGENPGGVLELFYRGTDKNIWHLYQQGGGWSGHTSLNVLTTSNIVAANNSDGRMELFYRGPDEKLWHFWRMATGATAPWTVTTGNGNSANPASFKGAGSMTSDPVVGVMPNKHLQVFFRGAEQSVWTIWRMADTPVHNGRWASHKNLTSGIANDDQDGEITTSRIALGTNGDGRFEIFYMGKNKKFWHTYQQTAGDNNSWVLPAAFDGDIGIIPDVNAQQGGNNGGNNAGGGSGPASTLSLDAAGLTGIENFEGLVLTCYVDATGNWTVGYGHMIKAGEYGKYCPGPISMDTAQQLLVADTGWAVQAVQSMVKVNLTQGQFDALVDFVYNVGSGAFQGSDLLAMLNQGDYAGAADQFLLWTNGGIPGLVMRRREDRNMFLNGSWT